jgi:hypothetical protein
VQGIDLLRFHFEDLDVEPLGLRPLASTVVLPGRIQRFPDRDHRVSCEMGRVTGGRP